MFLCVCVCVLCVLFILGKHSDVHADGSQLLKVISSGQGRSVLDGFTLFVNSPFLLEQHFVVSSEGQSHSNKLDLLLPPVASLIPHLCNHTYLQLSAQPNNRRAARHFCKDNVDVMVNYASLLFIHH